MRQASLFSFFGNSKQAAAADAAVSPQQEAESASSQEQRPVLVKQEESEGNDGESLSPAHEHPSPEEAEEADELPPPDDSVHEDGGVEGGVDAGVAMMMSGVSEYERLRQERIQANMAFLAKLGLDSIKQQIGPKPATTVDGDSGASKRRKRPLSSSAAAAAAAANNVSVPMRRSTRSTRFKGELVDDAGSGHVAAAAAGAGGAGAGGAGGDGASKQEEEDVFEEQYFDDSAIYKYVLSAAAEARSNEEGNSSSNEGQYPAVLDDGELTAAYSMHLHPRYPELLAAGGKNGRTAVYRISRHQNRSEHSHIMFSFRAHSGWVSDVSFVETEADQRRILLLTSSNDGSVKVWDLTKEQELMPQCLQTSKHLHRTGIFTMDLAGDQCLTGGKDATVCLSRIGADGRLEVVRSFQSLHSRVVKCVRWAPQQHSRHNHHGNVFASSGDDCAVNVVDQRQGEEVAIKLEAVHAGSVHSLRWHPTTEHWLLTAGKDTVIRLFDIRQTSQPLQSFEGHVPISVTAVKGIHHPEFCCDGDVVMTAAERSTRITFFHTADGRILSRGEVVSTPSCLLETPFVADECDSTNRRRRLIACALPGEGIKLLAPEYGDL